MHFRLFSHRIELGNPEEIIDLILGDLLHYGTFCIFPR